ncbi:MULTISPECIES: VRR-NUC domain-containing protein [unclassified Pseudomonas]|uniref:VRR-NUC domain-containing protein n=1 Tax=unclassified Pseudomonas TaxID=196821 RepID=UPI001C60F457|nr:MULTISPECIES: VRR-NUC domain-containing protein [unclassified Pseudomonas]MBW5416132.1 hypothetical protein [Pseudomonas sp. MAG002Y]
MSLRLPSLPTLAKRPRTRSVSSDRPSEHDEQANVVTWFNLSYPALKGCLFAIPNGTHLAGNQKQRGMKMAFLKAEGLTPGVGDLFLMVVRPPYSGLFIEMKRQRFTPSDVGEEQRKFIKRAREHGYRAEICGGFDAARLIIQEYLDGCCSKSQSKTDKA